MAKAKSFNLSPNMPYRVRESGKAKHVSIKVSHLGEVEIVVPQGFNARRIPAILRQRQDWIAKTLQRMKIERAAVQEAEPDDGQLPQQISLRSIGEDWTISYQQTEGTQVRATASGGQHLVISGAIDHVAACHQVLQRWLKRKAELHFTPWLQQVSKEIALPCGSISVRKQKTRWASCSSQKSISLNVKLLFLPPPLVRYVFIHELCHTIHLNHSAEFWGLVSEKESGWEPIDAELSRGWRYVPEWVERSI